MGTPRSSLVLSVVAMLLIGTGLTRAQTSEEDLKTRFRDEAPRRWREYHAWAQRLQGSSTTQGKTFKDQVVMKRNPECILLISERLESTSAEAPLHGEAFAINPVYSFALERKGPGHSWVLVELRMRREGILPEIEQMLKPSQESTPGLIAVYGESLLKLVAQPSFTVLRVVPLRHDGEELVQVDFDNTHPVKLGDDKFFPLQSGSMILDPARFWCVRSYDVRGKHPRQEVSRKMEIELRDPAAKHPIPKRYTEVRDVTNEGVGRSVARYVTEIDYSEPSPLPSDEEFTLTAFGLPEPPGVVWKKPTPSWLWGTLAGVALLVVAGVFGWLKRRASAARS